MLAQGPGPLGPPVFVALSAHEQVSVVLEGLSGDGQATAAVAFVADEAYWSAAAAGSVHAVHPSWELPCGFADKGFPFGWTREGPPFDWVYEVLPFDSLVEDHPSGSGHAGHPRELERGDHPYRMIW